VSRPAGERPARDDAPARAADGGDDGIRTISAIAYGFMGSQALFAALDLGLFTALSGGPGRSGDLAARLGAAPGPLDALLTACVALGLLEHHPEGFRNSPAAERYLVRASPRYIGDYYLHQIAQTLYPQLPVARAVLRGGLTTPPTYAAFLDDATRAEAFIRGQHAGSSGPAYLLAKSEDLSAFSRLLDLGGGSGAFAIEAVRRYPKLTAVVFDHPRVIAVAEKIVGESGVAGRIQCLAGDLLADAWPDGADVLLLSYVISSYAPESVRTLAARAHAYLPAGGLLIVHDFALAADRRGPRHAALWFFANLAISATTHAYTAEEIAGALGQAGFLGVAVRAHLPDMTWRFLARKSAGSP
jgi:SAM-dependent methyltransferase